MDRSEFGKSFTSDSSLARLYEPAFAEITVEGEKISFYMLKATKKIIGTIKATKPDTKQESNQIIFSIKFKSSTTLVKVPSELDSSKILQVDRTAIDPEYEGQGIASFVYISLAKAGYIIISDSSQFEPGAQLWKKLAREAHVKNYEIYVLDDEYGFMKDENGKIIKYDASNIDDAKIWSHDQDFSGSHILLTLKHH